MEGVLEQYIWRIGGEVSASPELSRSGLRWVLTTAASRSRAACWWVTLHRYRELSLGAKYARPRRTARSIGSDVLRILRAGGVKPAARRSRCRRRRKKFARCSSSYGSREELLNSQSRQRRAAGLLGTSMEIWNRKTPADADDLGDQALSLKSLLGAYPSWCVYGPRSLSAYLVARLS